ncbi:DUF835 domain-containing protein [Pyrococcus abyssi]|uniref:DUF835 domain-containing protein n=1 Tax=Pyrococcus abyssi (strain GE5 / Orsay) TaxID=272844 RepID=Q9UY06_PYRAB|nr:DUF835 domain-containing protein [Pyrococcus abyssi]CAB50606.1 hypothetical protein PAB1116 [Pyrococcus abyssi GE5]CCE71172.1 TPA: hypothetical protein PAB1116 [Pyrococcus abyssi GE5]
MITDLVPYLNLLSRLILFISSSYKAVKTRDSGWIILSFAFLLPILDIEEFILAPLNVEVKENNILNVIPNFYYAILFTMAGTLIRYRRITAKTSMIIGSTLLIAQILMFGNATKAINTLVVSIIAYLGYGLSMVYLGFVLISHSRGTIETLFPIGTIGVGLLNLTYPITSNIPILSTSFFTLAAIFRFMAAIGAIKMIILIPEEPRKSKRTKGLQPGAYWTESKKGALELISQSNPVIITRRNPLDINFPAAIYWITKAKEGKIRENVYAISPTKIDILIDLINRAFEMGYKTLYIDCLEYLALENGTNATLKFLYTIKDIITKHNGVILLALNPKTFEEREVKMIEKEFKKI